MISDEVVNQDDEMNESYLILCFWENDNDYLKFDSVIIHNSI
mgnify:FL=1